MINAIKRKVLRITLHNILMWVFVILGVYPAGATTLKTYTDGNGIKWHMAAVSGDEPEVGTLYGPARNVGSVYVTDIVLKQSHDHIAIPSQLTWYFVDSSGDFVKPTVKYITSAATCDHPNLESVAVNVSVEFKPPYFKDCPKLQAFRISNSDTYQPPNSGLYAVQGGVLFSRDLTSLKKYPEGKSETEYVVPSTVTELEKYCFANTGLTTIRFSGDVPSTIGSNAFSGSDNLTYVSYPQGASGWGSALSGIPAYAIPKAVTGVSASRGTSASAITVSWSENPVAKSYKIYRSETQSSLGVLLGTVSGSSLFQDTSASADRKYYYVVVAVNGPVTGTYSARAPGWLKGLAYTITYRPGSQGSGTVQTQSKQAGSSATLKGAIFTRTGYTQTGWATSDGGAQKYSLGGTYSSDDAITLYPAWTAVPTTYTVCFNANDGTGTMANQNITYGASTALKANAFTKSGYTFSGWALTSGGSVAYSDGASVLNLTSIGGSITLYAIWEKATTYTVVFNANGGSGTMENQIIWFCTFEQVGSGSLVFIDDRGANWELSANAFTKPNCTFAGWALTPEGEAVYADKAKVTNLALAGETITLYAVWSIATETYTITYSPGEYSSGATYEQTFTASDLPVTLREKTYSRDGYVQTGWKDSEVDNSWGMFVVQKFDLGGSYSSSANITLYPEWSGSYTVVFDANGGTGDMSSQTMTYGDYAELKANEFTRSGYAFSGWAISSSGSSAYPDCKLVRNLASVGESITLYAVWTADGSPCQIVFYANDGTGDATVSRQVGECLGTLPTPTRSGYKLVGWQIVSGYRIETRTEGGTTVQYVLPTFSDVDLSPSTLVTDSVSYYAKWQEIADTTYTVHFNANGGSGTMSSQTITYGVSTALNANAFTRSGYTFAGWAKTSDGSVAYADGTTVSNLASAGGSVTLYAIWDEEVTSCTIVFNANGGSGSMANQVIAYGVTVALNANAFTRNGYNFAGWARSSGGAVEFRNCGLTVNQTDENRTITLYAKWSPMSYTVTYSPGANGSGSEYSTSKKHDVSLKLAGATFTRAGGYGQTGWAIYDGGPLVYALGATYTANEPITLYPTWSLESEDVYEYSSVTGGVEITKYNGTAEDVYVPSTLGGQKVVGIGAGAFRNSSKMKRITFPEGLEYIGNWAFGDCSWLHSIDIPDSVKSIGEIAFSYCSSLQILTIGAGLNTIGDGAFGACRSLTQINVSTQNTSFCLVDEVLYDTAKTTLYICPKTKREVHLPTGIVKIAEDAFSYCTNIVSVTLPDTITEMGDDVFQECDKLESVILPSGIRRIGYDAFEDCDSLISIDIPLGVTEIGPYAFYDCRSLKSVTIPGSVTNIAYDAFGGCRSLESMTLAEGLISIGSSAFEYCSSLKTITIPNTVRSIGREAFSYCSGLGAGVVIIDGCVLAVNGECPTSVAIPSGVRLIAGGVFKGKTTLQTVNMSDGVVSIGEQAFMNCTALSSIRFSANLTEIGWAAAAENLKQVFGLEGGTSLEAGDLSSENVDITFGVPENGKVKFTAGPKDTTTGTFFMRVKMNP